MRLTPDTDSPNADSPKSAVPAPELQHAASHAEMPPSFLREEKRLAGRALQAWRRSQRTGVPGFEATSLTIADPGGQVMVLQVAPAIAATFDIAIGQSLALSPKYTHKGAHGIAAELRAACDLVALGGRPIPFEASLVEAVAPQSAMARPQRSVVLVRGVVLPLLQRGVLCDIDTVQIVLSWREVLNRSASTRLRHELGDALRSRAAQSPSAEDPFPIHHRSARPKVVLSNEQDNIHR